MNKKLYLASTSSGRQTLLREAGFEYECISHSSPENLVQGDLNFNEYVLEIARDKMKCIELPVHLSFPGSFFIITADTLVQGEQSGTICRKPLDWNDAERMLEMWRRERAIVTTACCIERRTYDEEGSEVERTRKECIVSSLVEFHVPRNLQQAYFNHFPQVLQSAGAGIIEGYGLQFVKRIEGSWSAVIGLPIYEVRILLEELGF
jgi:septum formation protein